MQVVSDKSEFEKISYYNPAHLEEKDYPREYPCIVEFEDREGGIMGQYVKTIFTYCPEGLDWNSWLEGYKMGSKRK